MGHQRQARALNKLIRSGDPVTIAAVVRATLGTASLKETHLHFTATA